MKDIGIYYKSSTCGMFLLYYILGSDQKFNVTARNQDLDYGTNKKLMTSMFYTQFKPKKYGEWISGEYLPDNLFADNDLPKFYYFQIHDFAPLSESIVLEKYRKNDLYKKLDCIKITPYIPNESKWYKLMFYKRSGSFHYFTKENFTFKEFYQPEQLIAIGMSGGAQDISVMSGKVPGLIDVGILGGCDCFTTSRPFWIPREFIKTIPRDMPIIMISGEKDDYIARANAYFKIAKDAGLNVELHIVSGGHDSKKTLLGKAGKDIVKAALQ